jgi:hypothetical protein
MRRLPVVLVLVLATALNGCTAGPRVGVRAPQSSAASANYGGDPLPEEHPVRDWIAAHPVATGVGVGVLTAVGVLVGAAAAVAYAVGHST